MKNPYPGRKALQDRCYLKKFKKFPIVEKIFQGVCPCSKCRPAYFEKQDKEAAGTDESWFLETTYDLKKIFQTTKILVHIKLLDLRQVFWAPDFELRIYFF